MNRKRHVLPILLPTIATLLLILDSKTATNAAAEGIDLCIRTVIPSLFPFCMLSILLTRAVIGTKIPIINYMGRLCAMPHGTEALLLVGFLGGYPTGAQSVAEAYRQGSISKNTASRLLGFCSNAGPAFIFGICGVLFSSRSAVWILWLIHIVSAIIVGILLPKTNDEDRCSIQNEDIQLQNAFRTSLKIMADVCGWIILFRVITGYLNRWLFWLLPEVCTLLVIGNFELANGIIALQSIAFEAVRFVLCAVLLASGGLCIGMQTCSVTRNLGTGWYFPGKLLQSCISFFLSMLIAYEIYGDIHELNIMIPVFVIMFLFTVLAIYQRKICVAFRLRRVYNTKKRQGSCRHAVP